MKQISRMMGIPFTRRKLANSFWSLSSRFPSISGYKYISIKHQSKIHTHKCKIHMIERTNLSCETCPRDSHQYRALFLCKNALTTIHHAWLVVLGPGLFALAFAVSKQTFLIEAYRNISVNALWQSNSENNAIAITFKKNF
jgi:hypothetical protein